ncbi:MAG: hypothetical protein VX527_10520, partial [Planctomycetota bacterium]|nr:hypothetical protein [Planctomycetota bacterium]
MQSMMTRSSWSTENSKAQHSTALLLTSMFLISISSLTANAEMWTVDDDRVQNPNAQFLTIQDAIDHAADGDLITIWPGTYVGIGTNPLTGLPNPVMRLENRTLEIEGLEIDGEIVIIDGEHERRGIQCEVHGDDAHEISLTGLHVTRGRGVVFSDIPNDLTETYQSECGGGLLAYRIVLFVESCQFNASSSKWGGAAACYQSNINMTACSFKNNHSDHYAGALGIGNKSNIIVSGCQFQSNTARSGGAISTRESMPLSSGINCNCEWNMGNNNCHPDDLCYYECDLDGNPLCLPCTADPIQCFGWIGGTWIIDSNLSDNSAVISGGAICVGGQLETNQGENVRAYLSDCTLENNTTGKLGGALWAFGPTHLLITRCNIIANQADVCFGQGGGIGGGGLAIQGADYARLTDCVLEGNGTSEDGGGLYALENHLRVLRTQFTDNWAQGGDSEGGGLFVKDGWWTSMDGCSFVGNTASTRGGAISTDKNTTAPFTILNTQFEQNLAWYNQAMVCNSCNECWPDDPVYCQCDDGFGNSGPNIAQNVQGGA